MTTSMPTKTIALAAAFVLTLLLAGPAAAKPKPKPPKPATFRMSIDGEQLTTWNYIKQQQPSCDWPEYGDGRQYISFDTYSPTRVQVAPKQGGGVSIKVPSIAAGLHAKAETVHNYRYLYAQMSDCPGGGGPFGGDGPPANEIGTNKCTIEGELDMYFGASIGEVENPSYPTDLPNDPDDGKDRFYFAADPYWELDPSPYVDRSLPAACDASGQYNADLGITVSQGEWAGAIVPAGKLFSAKKLLNGKQKKTTIELSRTVKYPNSVQDWPGPDSTTGKTQMDATFTFERIGKKGGGKKGGGKK